MCTKRNIFGILYCSLEFMQSKPYISKPSDYFLLKHKLVLLLSFFHKLKIMVSYCRKSIFKALTLTSWLASFFWLDASENWNIFFCSWVVYAKIGFDTFIKYAANNFLYALPFAVLMDDMNCSYYFIVTLIFNFEEKFYNGTFFLC